MAKKTIGLEIIILFMLFFMFTIYLVNTLKPSSGTIVSSPVQLVPVNVETRGLSQSYYQMGILSRSNDTILPLMGRQLFTNKWQYYAISNTGSINTKLPIVINGKKGSSEYGCDQLSNGDVVYVDGYQDTFYTTLYEGEKLQYIPYV